VIADSEAAQDAVLFWSVARAAREQARAGAPFVAAEFADEIQMIGIHAVSPAVRLRCARLERDLNRAHAVA
jgi:hypothetical protein